MDGLYEFTLPKYKSFFPLLLECHSAIHDCSLFLITCTLALPIALCDEKMLTYIRQIHSCKLLLFFFLEKCSFYKHSFRQPYLHTDVYVLISALFTKDLELAL